MFRRFRPVPREVHGEYGDGCRGDTWHPSGLAQGLGATFLESLDRLSRQPRNRAELKRVWDSPILRP